MREKGLRNWWFSNIFSPLSAGRIKAWKKVFGTFFSSLKAAERASASKTMNEMLVSAKKWLKWLK